MPLTGSQKFATLCLPVAAIGLAFATDGPEWNPPRPWGSWRAALEAKAAKEAAPVTPMPPAPPAPPASPAPPVAGPAPAPAPAPAPTPPKAPEAPPAPPKSAAPLPVPGEIDYKVSGVATAKSGSPLTFPAAERLDVLVGGSGMARIGTGFPDAEAAKKTVLDAEAAKKEKGLLYIVPNSRAPWEPVRDLLAAGAAGGWKRVALGVASPTDAARGRILELALPGNADPDLAKGMDPNIVKVKGTPSTPSFELNGEACADGAALEAKAKALHAESEEFTPGYAAAADATPWIVDGAGGTAGGVVAALDALAQAGIPSVRLAGVTRVAPVKPAVEGTEEDAPPAEGKPDGEKPAEEKPAEKKSEGGGGDGGSGGGG